MGLLLGIGNHISKNTRLGSKLNQIPVGALTNKAGTKYIVTVSGKYLTIKT